MARRKKQQAEPLPTIWRVDDALWAKAEKVLEEHDPPARFGPERIDQRKALDGVITACAAACSGTSCRGSSATTPASTARSSGG